MYRYYETNLYLRIHWDDIKKNIQNRKLPKPNYYFS